MRDYDEIYAPEYVRVHSDDIEDYKKTIEEIEEKNIDLEQEIEELENDLEEVQTDLKYFLKRFIEKGNEEGKTLEQAYAEMFEIFKGFGYEKYI